MTGAKQATFVYDQISVDELGIVEKAPFMIYVECPCYLGRAGLDSGVWRGPWW